MELFAFRRSSSTTEHEVLDSSTSKASKYMIPLRDWTSEVPSTDEWDCRVPSQCKVIVYSAPWPNGEICLCMALQPSAFVFYIMQSLACPEQNQVIEKVSLSYLPVDDAYYDIKYDLILLSQ